MSHIMDDIADWQRRFWAQPKAYVVVDREQIVEGVYETKDAAQLAVDWHREHAPRERLRILEMPICSMELSRERWSNR